jgi:HEAT repeat protein
MMGRIGTVAHFEILETVLTHEDFRVQREAVFAIQNIGGDGIDEIFLRKLYSVEDETKGIIISVLGFLKSTASVPVLIDVIETRALGKTKKTKNHILIKSCEALGRIGNTAALPALEKIGHSKGFFSIKSVDPEVRAAAKEALVLLKNR